MGRKNLFPFVEVETVRRSTSQGCLKSYKHLCLTWTIMGREFLLSLQFPDCPFHVRQITLLIIIIRDFSGIHFNHPFHHLFFRNLSCSLPENVEPMIKCITTRTASIYFDQSLLKPNRDRGLWLKSWLCQQEEIKYIRKEREIRWHGRVITLVLMVDAWLTLHYNRTNAALFWLKDPDLWR